MLQTYGLKFATRMYIHLFPYGYVSATAGLSVEAATDLPLDEFVRVLQRLVGRRTAPTIRFKRAGGAWGSVDDLLSEALRSVVAAVAPGADPPRYVHTDYGVLVSAGPEEVTDEELAALLTLDERFADFSDRWVTSQASLFGKFSGDRVLVTTASTAVAVSPTYFSRRAHRRLFWRVLQVLELARAQARVLYPASENLRRVGRRGGPNELELHRLLAVGEHLVDFHRGLPAHHRKLYHKCCEALGTHTVIRAYQQALSDMHQRVAVYTLTTEVRTMERVRINVTGGQIGTLNLGTIVGNVENHLTVLAQRDEEEVVAALRQLAEAVVSAEDLDEPTKQELVEEVDFLAEEAAKEPADRRKGAVRAVLDRLNQAVTTAESLVSLWPVVGPPLLKFFGLG